MGFTKALYYPTIDIKDEDWLKTAVLFWDEISTIVPHSDSKPYRLYQTQYLADEGILNPITVSPDEQLVQELSTDTINFLNTNEAFQLLTNTGNYDTFIHRDKMPLSVTRMFQIHPDKLSYEIQDFLRGTLTEDGYFRVNERFSKFYMTLLANKICEKKGIALLTDSPLSSNFADKAKLDNQISMRRFRYGYNEDRKGGHIHLAQGMLTNLIIENIRVNPNTSLADIVKFKKDQNHRDELGVFRSKISDLTKSVSTQGSFEAIRQNVNDIYNDEFLPSFNNLKRSLNGSGIKWISDNFMKIALISTSTTALPMTLGLSIPQALLAGAGISMVTSFVSYNEDKKEKIRTNPYSYLLSIDNFII